jgi:opacity protein-like surface antigen
MKKVLLASAVLAQIASPALAADWPVIAPTYGVAPEVVSPPAIYSWWTGCYVGGNIRRRLGTTWLRPRQLPGG